MKKLLVLTLLFSSSTNAAWQAREVNNQSREEIIITTRDLGRAPGLVSPSGVAYYLGGAMRRPLNKTLSNTETIYVITQAGRFSHRGEDNTAYNIEIYEDGKVFFTQLIQEQPRPVRRRVLSPSTSPPASGWEEYTPERLQRESTAPAE